MPSGALCGLGQLSCLRAEFTVRRASDSVVVDGPTVVTGLTAGQVTAVSPAADLVDGVSYVLSVRAFNQLNDVWSSSSSLAFRVALPPATPTVTWLDPDGSTLQIGVAGAAASHSWRVTLSSWLDGSVVELTGSAVAVNGVLRIPLVLDPGWMGGVEVRVAAVSASGAVSAESAPVTDSLFL
jgi:hypothetical protein